MPAKKIEDLIPAEKIIQNATLTYYDVFTDPSLAAKTIGYRKGQQCTIVGLYEQPRAAVKYVTDFSDASGPTGSLLPLKSEKTWVLVSTAPPPLNTN